MAAPPVLGADHDKVTVPSPWIPVGAAGAAGATAAGEELSEATPVPTEFFALTLNMYTAPPGNPEIVTFVEVLAV